MKTMFKHKFFSAMALAAALFAGYSCEEKDLFVFPEPTDAELTSLEVMRKDPDLSNFLSVVDMCGEGCLDSLLNQSRVYTIWAPSNEAVNKDSLIECIEEGNRESVFQQFVKYHISNFRVPANGELPSDNKVMMLNGKYIVFSGNPEDGYKFDNNEVLETNIQTKNGIIHKVGSSAKYIPSIWEAIKSNKLIAGFWDYCNSFTEKTFNPGASVEGPIVDQQKTYLDSVFNETNEMLGNLGYIDNEDSLFVVYAPTTEVWEQITEDAVKYFNFKTDETWTQLQLDEADSIAKIRGAKEYIKYLTFSMNEQKFVDGNIDFDNLPDTIYSKNKGPVLVVESKIFNPIERIKASNGELRILDYMPYKPSDLWHDTILVEAENESNYRKYKVDGEDHIDRLGSFNTISVNDKDLNPIYKGEKTQYYNYLSAYPISGTMPHIRFFVRNILSAKYKIALVVIPEDIKVGTELPATTYQSSLKVTVSQNGKDMYVCPSDKNYESTSKSYKQSIRPDKSKIDTLFLYDEDTKEDFIFEFENCEAFNGITTRSFEEKDYTVEIKVETAVPAKEFSLLPGLPPMYVADNEYSQIFRLDKIILVPVEEE